uniref:Uncharacterized protein n=1 Tax=Arundo donax TaxID=35708 RepID=A0A0A9EAC0_ARUDO
MSCRRLRLVVDAIV